MAEHRRQLRPHVDAQWVTIRPSWEADDCTYAALAVEGEAAWPHMPPVLGHPRCGSQDRAGCSCLHPVQNFLIATHFDAV